MSDPSNRFDPVAATTPTPPRAKGPCNASPREVPPPGEPAPEGDLFEALRRVSLYAFIVFLSLGALLSIAAILSDRFGEAEVKILLTTFLIAYSCVCALCCSAYASRTRTPVPAIVGIVLAVVSGAMLIVGLWTEAASEVYWKTAVVATVYAIAFAHSLALLSVRLPASRTWVRLVAVLDIFTLATLIVLAVVGETGEAFLFRVIAVLSIVAALVTLVIPILGILGRATAADADADSAALTIETGPEGATAEHGHFDPSPQEVLCLVKRPDGLHEDRHGRLFEVRELQPEPSATGARRNENEK